MSSEMMKPRSTEEGTSEKSPPPASSIIGQTPLEDHSPTVCSIPPPECRIPLLNALKRPLGGTASFKIPLIWPEIDLSSGLTPARDEPLNQILLLGPSPPIRWSKTWQSFLIPCETKSAEFTALASTSIRPPEPARSFRFRAPELGALWPMIANHLSS